MLYNHLENSINDLELIIEYTKKDIEDIKIANNDSIFDRNKLKMAAIKSFEINKGLLDREMMALVRNNPSKSLEALIDERADELLGRLKSRLQELKQINMSYARMAFAVSEFYSSLIERIIPKEKADYKSEVLKSQILQIQV